jgi:hypothetical protein
MYNKEFEIDLLLFENEEFLSISETEEIISQGFVEPKSSSFSIKVIPEENESLKFIELL